MTLEQLLKEVPDLEEYIRYMPEELNHRYTIRIIPPGVIIHQKHAILDYFGIVCKGEHRVINEFENGNVFMIEKNEPIDFIGEVTILANKKESSVTIETLTECTILYFSRKDFEQWIACDIHFLRLVSQKVAYKLYRSSYNRGDRLFYPPTFLLLDYLIKYIKGKKITEKGIILPKTRQQLYEELGITIKTINRTIKRLKEDDLIGIQKGKITMNKIQYERALKEIHYYVK
ncbi:cAMP-activated global transcriptional regulator CRP [Clostridiales bacterium CHKCI001]|nr:cAMP-activated global transcriptional regulator CRP [Clostridiales bacterium CHKCI001]